MKIFTFYNEEPKKRFEQQCDTLKTVYTYKELPDKSVTEGLSTDTDSLLESTIHELLLRDVNETLTNTPPIHGSH